MTPREILTALEDAVCLIHEMRLRVKPISSDNPIWTKLYRAEQYLFKQIDRMFNEICGEDEL